MTSQTRGGRPSRRALLTCAAVAAVSTTVPASGRAWAAPPRGTAIDRALRDLERAHSARLGVFAHNTLTGRGVAYRAAERFPVCSVFKTIAAAAVLRDLDRNGEFLARRVHYTRADVQASGYAPITGTPDHLAHGMTVGELCAAAIDHSDNAAANLMLRALGGPAAVTRFCRSIGDPTTRLDRWEPALNSAEPWRRTDTTSPAAIARTYGRLTLGDALAPRDRRRLTDWLLADTTSAARFHAGLPRGWAIADKTGTGGYGTTNDVGVAWTRKRVPIVLAVLSTKRDAHAPADDALVARAAALVAAAVA